MQDLMLALGWTEIVSQLIIYVVIGVVLPYLGVLVTRYFKIKIDDKTRGYVEDALRAAIRHAVSSYATRNQISIAETMTKSVTDNMVRETIATGAAGYVQQAVPKGLQRLGIQDPLKVQDLATARLDKTLNDMSSDVQGVLDSITDFNFTKNSGMSTPSRHVPS